MRISTKGRYALRIMIDLALNGNGNFISLKSIAERQEISNKYLEQIVSLLNKAGLLEVARGNSGGYRLAKEPRYYIVLLEMANVKKNMTVGLMHFGKD